MFVRQRILVTYGDNVRMKKLALFLVLLPACVYAQTGVLQGHCFLGGKQAITSGMNSTNYANGIVPACTVTVYLTGTTNMATITKPDGSALSNPFTANTATAVDPGGWIFRAATNVGLDVVMSGGNSNPSCITAPNCYVQPVTLVDVFPSQSFNPIGGVTSLSSVAPIKVNAGTGPVTGGVTVTCDNATNSTVGCSRPDGTSIVSTGGVYSVGTVNIQSSLQMQSTPPTGATYIKVYPSGFTASGPDTQFYATGSNTAALVESFGCTLGGCSGVGPAQVTWTFTLPSYVNPANVTAVWASATLNALAPFGNTNGHEADGGMTCSQGANTYNLFGSGFPTSYGPIYAMQQFNAHMTAVSGSQVSTVTCTAAVASSSVVQAGLQMNVASVYLQLADSVDTPPASTAINVAPPIFFNSALNELGIDPQAQFNGLSLIPTIVSKLPLASTSTNWIVPVADGTSPTDCSTGGGSTYVQCNSNGSSWVAYTPAGSGTVTTTGSPASGDIAAFSGSTSITTATATQVNTLIKTLTGCNTATYLYSPQSGTCVAPSGGGGAWTNITASVTASGCTVSGSKCVAGSPTATVSFSSIPNTYNHLVIMEQAASSQSGADDVYMQFNGDTGTNYTRQFINGTGTTTSSGQNVGVQKAAITNVPGTGAPANNGDGATITIYNYAGTTFLKTAISTHMDIAGSATSNIDMGISAFQWNSTAAITSVLLGPSGGNFITGSTFTIYGVN
jgi:hypothetical protein